MKKKYLGFIVTIVTIIFANSYLNVFQFNLFSASDQNIYVDKKK